MFRSHSLSGKERKALLLRACFSVLSRQTEQRHSSEPQSVGQCGYAVPETSSLPEQRKLPNPTSDENEDELISCPYDSCISYERVWGTNVPVMDYNIFKLHHPFSMLVAGPRGAVKSEFVKQTDPPERIVQFMVDINQTCFVL